MKNSQGQGFIRLRDKTSHGGEVTSAFAGFNAQGIPVAGEGCMTYCPRCQGEFEIFARGSGRRHNGKWLAYDTDETACGARLISSL
ncbi:PAAR domain-containing protein [Collimonas sp. H4R21]|uniref:PAAR domain-containing protein n=1 Tax=Collimonas rhizosphaerae TaxID=3126357 RepID=A0ABU9PY70_9BURK